MNFNLYTTTKLKSGFKTIARALFVALIMVYTAPSFAQTNPAAPTAISASPATVCQGSSTNLKATSAGNTIRWYSSASNGGSIGATNSGAALSVSPSASMTYSAQSVSSTGDTSLTRATITVNVNTRPTVTSTPDNINANNDASFCGAVVNYPPATAAGIPAPSLLYSNVSGSAFDVGTTTVVVTAVNTCGNSSLSFDVNVTDNEPPTVISPPDTNIVAPAGVTSLSNVNLGTPYVYDNCGVSTITNDAPATFMAGTTTVTWTISDEHGHNASATQHVTIVVVNNNTPPAVSGVTTSDADNTIAQNSQIVLNISWNDESNGGPYSVDIDWRDSSAHTILSGITGHSVSPGHTYHKTGVFAPVIIVSDGGNLSSSFIFKYVVVYVVGNYSTTADGNFTAPYGSLVASPTLTPSHSNVAFGDQCKPSSCHPGDFDGDVELNMGYAKFDFETENVDWDYLAVSACYMAQFTGTGYMYPSGHKFGCHGNCHGACNPSGYKYGILVTQTDKFNGGANGNKIRVKIWNKTTGAIIFDTQMGDADNAMPTTPFNGCIKVRVPSSCVARKEAADLPAGTFDASVYPNPSQSDFNILVNSSSDDNVEVSVYDMLGKQVQYNSEVLPNQPINLHNNLPGGMYIMHIKQGSNIKMVTLVKDNK